MESSTSTLVLVVHPGDDEALGCSSVCREADIVSVTDGGWHRPTAAFRRACAMLGGQQALSLNLPAVYPHRLPNELLVSKLRELGPSHRVYTHSPLEKRAHHQDVALAASRCFGEVWVRICGGYAAEAHVFSQSTFEQKMDILARVRAKHLRTSHFANFDDQASLLLQRFEWDKIASVQIFPRFEPVDGRSSFLLTRRPGSNNRLWKPS